MLAGTGDRRNRLMAWERLRRGGIAEVAIYPRDVLEAALLRKASGIILVHNHPGGNPAPSQEDRLLTEELQRLAPRMGLRFLDHVIVTDGDCYSITQSQRILTRKQSGRLYMADINEKDILLHQEVNPLRQSPPLTRNRTIRN